MSNFFRFDIHVDRCVNWRVGSRVLDGVGGGAGDRVYDRVWIRVGNRVCDRVWDRVLVRAFGEVNR